MAKRGEEQDFAFVFPDGSFGFEDPLPAERYDTAPDASPGRGARGQLLPLSSVAAGAREIRETV